MAEFWRAVVDGKLTEEGIEDLTGRSPHKVMPKSALVHADEPLLFYTEETPDEVVDLSDFPNLAPQFSATFIERTLTWRVLGAQGDPMPSWKDETWRQGRWVPGLLIEAVDLGRGGFVARARARRLREAMSGVAGDGAFAKDVKWSLVIYLYGANPQDARVEGPQVVWLIPVKKDGTVQPNRTGEGPSLTRVPLGGAMRELKTLPAQSAYADAARVYLYPALFAYAALNSPLTRPTKVETNGLGPRGNTYRTDTKELEEVLINVGGAKEHGLVRAMLTCRGHFFRA